MVKKRIQFSSAQTIFYFDASINLIKELAGERTVVVLTDENVFEAHKRKFTKFNTVVIPAGEKFKVQSTVDTVLEKLIEYSADRKSLLVGVGGGVVTDIAGYVASIFMRGISVAFVPTSLLAMVDAAIGGKNGIDIGVYKNLAGTIRQPEFLIYDYNLLKTLPQQEWVNGMAEVIKHAAIKDLPMFKMLEAGNLAKLMRNRALQHNLIMRNAFIKIKVVQGDEFEQGDRKLLNLGHTLGHAIENTLEISHGHAISIGMVYAAHLSASQLGFKQVSKLIDLLEQYELPTHAEFDMQQALQKILMDKKRINDTLHFVLMQKIGRAVVHPFSLKELEEHLASI